MPAWKGLCRLVGLVLLVLSLSGCSKPTGTVTGKVTLKKQAVPGAELRFEPADNASELYRGLTEEDGTLRVDYKKLGGLPVGAYKVTITYHTLHSKLLPPGEKGTSLKSEEDLVTHQVVFEKTITTGNNDLQFDVSQGKKVSK
jgi:hypothetical protein